MKRNMAIGHLENLPTNGARPNEPQTPVILSKLIPSDKRRKPDEHYQVGLLHLTGDAAACGIEKNDALATAQFKSAIAKSNGTHREAKVSLAKLILQARADGNESEALKWLIEAADDGDESAQFNLGLLYEGAFVLQRDVKEAIKWYKKAAKQGNKAAECNMLTINERSPNFSPQDPRAIDWWLIEAKYGSPSAQFNLGLAYAGNFGGEPNAEESFYWLNKAAENDVVEAQCVVGLMHAQGLAEKKPDYLKATKWLVRAAAQGYEVAILSLESVLRKFYSQSSRNSDIIPYREESDEITTSPVVSTLNDEKRVRVPFDLKESYREALKESAAKNGMQLTEFLRRAAFAAMTDPSVLDIGRELESQYLQSLGPSRWDKGLE